MRNLVLRRCHKQYNKQRQVIYGNTEMDANADGKMMICCILRYAQFLDFKARLNIILILIIILPSYKANTTRPMQEQPQEIPHKFSHHQTHHHPQHALYISPHNWLSKIPDDTPVTHLSIPGTHDSAAYHSPVWYHQVFSSPFWKTQDYNISEQLNMGIRFFDIRVKCQPGEKLTLYHGDVYLGEFNRVIQPIYKFMKNQLGEFVALLFQKEQGVENSCDSGKKILREIKELTFNQIPIYQSECGFEKMPTVGDIRGKLWIIQAYPGNKNRVDLVGHLQVSTYSQTKILSDGCKYIIQNHWEGPEHTKKEGILHVLNSKDNLLKFNFITQSPTPRIFALKYNRWFRKMVEEKNMRKLGFVLIDFPDKKLIQAIIKSNF